MAVNLVPWWIADAYRNSRLEGQFWTAGLFVDISGFTGLTESLMERHKGGAEALTEAIEAIFNPLIHEVYARGGVIPLFAGDAFTALFPIYEQELSSFGGTKFLSGTRGNSREADVVQQAMEAAFLIQQQLAAHDSIGQTRYGDFAIGVKVGLSCGLAEWGIVAEGGRASFYVRGPAVTGCAEAQQAAGRGEVVADASLRPYLPAEVEVLTIAGTAYDRLVNQAPIEKRTAAEPAALSEADLAAFIHPAVLGLAARAEFRDVCPIFISFEEPADSLTLSSFVGRTIALVEQYGGYFSQVEFSDKGGILLILFGAPLAHENNVARATEFLLALRAATLPPLRWRAGMTSGTVWAGMRGNDYRSEYSVVGDVVNLSARLAAAAPWGEVWLPLAAYQGVQQAYHAESAGTFRFKGKQVETMVYRLVGKKMAAEPTYTTSLVGREAEVTAVQVALRPILDGRFAGLTTVYGEAGVGKSRLVYEVRRQTAEVTRGAQWFTCPAEPILRQSLHPFRYFLRGYFGQSGEQTAVMNRASFDEGLNRLLEWLPAAEAALGEELKRTRSFLAALVDIRWEGSLYERVEPKLRFENTLAAVVALLRAECLRRPVILHIEDGHWLDGDSVQLIKTITQQLGSAALAILLTRRYQDEGRPVALEVDAAVPQQRIDLDSLTAAGSQALAEQVLEGAVSGELAAFLVAKTEGNPFFVEQLSLDLRERGMIRRPAGEVWQIASQEIAEVPTGINSVLVARLDRLPAQVKAVVQAAAVLGQEFEVRLLFYMLKEDEQLPLKVRQAERDAIWSAMGEIHYLFKHALLRDAAYQMQLNARLRELHALAAEAIEQLYRQELASRAADLAHHFGRAGLVEPERRYARLAGEEAAGRFANREAVDYLSRAIVLTPPDDMAGRFDVLLLREQVYNRQGIRQTQASDLDELLALAETMNDNGRRAEAALRQTSYLETIGNFAAALETALGVAALGRQLEIVRYEAAGLMSQGRALTRLSDFAAAVDCVERALALAQAGRLPDIEAESLINLGVTAMYQGNYSLARNRIEQALLIFREQQARKGESSALGNLGVIASRQGDYTAAWDYYEQALGICREIGERRGESIALANLGDMALRRSDFAAAEMYLSQALRLYRDIGDRFGASIVLGNLGDLLQRLGRYDEARNRYQQSLQLCREIGDRGGESWVLANLALLDHELGEQGAAEAYGRQAVQIAQDVGARSEEAMAWAGLGHALLAGGRLAEAITAYQAALVIQRELGEQKQALRTLAGLAEAYLAQEDSAEAQQQIEEIWRYLQEQGTGGLDNPFRVYLTCYRVWQAAGDGRTAVIVRTAGNLLKKQADGIVDEGQRRIFLEEVAVHRELTAACGEEKGRD